MDNADFQRRYEADIRPQLQEFDRKNSGRNSWGWGLLIAGAIILLLAFLKARGGALVLFAPLPAAGILLLWLSSRSKRQCFKNILLPAVLKAKYPTLDYRPDAGIDSDIFARARLFGSFDRYHSEDHFSGKLGATRIELAEIHAERRVQTKNNTHYQTVFQGLMLIADCNKEFQGRTAVFPDVAERVFGSLLGRFLQNCNLLEDQAVRLEDPVFEQYFSVYSTDQVEARYLLSPSMMARLTALRQRLDTNLRVLFDCNRIVIAIDLASNWLEPPAFGALADPALVEHIETELDSVLGIVTELDLNTRIWSKA